VPTLRCARVPERQGECNRVGPNCVTWPSLLGHDFGQPCAIFVAHLAAAGDNRVRHRRDRTATTRRRCTARRCTATPPWSPSCSAPTPVRAATVYARRPAPPPLPPRCRTHPPSRVCATPARS
jgi:hypothetical protein